MIHRIIIKIIILLCKIELKDVRKRQITPYMYLKGTGKDYPNYLVFTDDEEYMKKLHYMDYFK